MKVLKSLLVIALIAGFAFAIQPTATEAQDNGGTLSCQTYASYMSGWWNVGPGASIGWNGPFEPGIYVITVTPAEGVSATVRLVADPAGATTLAGPVAAPTTFVYHMPEIGSQPPGLGIYVNAASGGEVAAINISASCSAAGCDAMVPIPSQAVVGAFTQNSELYWAPGEVVSGNPYIEAGNTYYVAGQDETGMYRKVLISCQWVWVRAETVGPNYDDVWNGAPLPTTVVD